MSIYLLQTTYPHTIIFFVSYFHVIQNQHMLFWFLKDAQLTCNRCPFEVLLTPFWSPIKHLFLYSFTTYWFSVGYEGESKGSFGVILRVLVLCFCKENSNSVSGSNDVIKGWMRRKNTLFWGNIYFIVLFGQLLSNKNRNKKAGI